MKRITVTVLSVALGIGAVACSDKNPSGPDNANVKPPPGLVVSNRHPGSSSASSVSVSYISAAPSTFPDAVSAALRNETKGGIAQPVQLIDGGFDPVAIGAAVGDALSLVLSIDGGGSTSVPVSVPERRDPEIVRTNPPRD